MLAHGQKLWAGRASLRAAGRRDISSPCSRDFQEQLLSRSGRDEPRRRVKVNPFWKGDGRKQIARIRPHDHEGPIHPQVGCTGGGAKAKCSQTAENKALLGF